MKTPDRISGEAALQPAPLNSSVEECLRDTKEVGGSILPSEVQNEQTVSEYGLLVFVIMKRNTP